MERGRFRGTDKDLLTSEDICMLMLAERDAEEKINKALGLVEWNRNRLTDEGEIDSEIYEGEWLPTLINYYAVDNREYYPGTASTPPCSSGCIDVEYSVEVFDCDGYSLVKSCGTFQTS